MGHESSAGNGYVRLDGNGKPSLPNAWISRTINLPQNATKLTFALSADDVAHADAGFQVRIVADGLSTALERGTAGNVHPGKLDFRTVSVGISAWAGKTVTFFFEQNDNGVNGVFGNDQDEQPYYDTIRIVRG